MKKLILGILILLFLYLVYHFSSVKYGLEQAYGQFKVLSSAVPLEEYLKQDPPDSVLTKIQLISNIKSFAENDLGLEKTDSYNSIYDQKGKAILWMVTASPEFELKAYKWKFPIAGEFEYKGFFDLKKAKAESTKMKEMGYDVDIDEVSAWSTLGFFSDPILSSMFSKDSGRLADLIIHELCLASIYLKDSVELNENLASFIGRKGAGEFLLSKKDTAAVFRMKENRRRSNKWRKIIYTGSVRLDSLYSTFLENLDIEEKRKLKKAVIDQIRWEVSEAIYGDDLAKVQKQFSDFQPNNAFFTGYLTYRARSDQFENELADRFDGNLKAFIEYYIQEYGIN